MRSIFLALFATSAVQWCYAGGAVGGCSPVTVTCFETTTEYCTITATTTEFCTVTQTSTCTVSFTTTTTLTYSSCPVTPPCNSVITTTTTTTTTTTSIATLPCSSKETSLTITTTTEYSTTKYEPTTITTSSTTTTTTSLPPPIPNGGIVGIGLGAAFAGLAAALLLPFLFTRKSRTDATQTTDAGEGGSVDGDQGRPGY